jgi:hypothetical protein
MSKLKFLLLGLLSFASVSSKADWDIWQGYFIANFGASDIYYRYNTGTSDIANPALDNAFLGRFSSTSVFTLRGAETKTFKNNTNGNSNVCSTSMFYRIYKSCDAPGSFIQVSTPFSCNHPCTGTNNPGDQIWNNSGVNSNILSGLTEPGTYIVEVYFDAFGGQFGTCDFTKSANNGGNNYKMYFEYDNTDSFTDGNFTANATWTGNTSNFQVVNNSDVSGLIGTESTRTHTVRLNAPAVLGNSYISTQIASWLAQQNWYFWMGRRSNASADNRVRIWLYANSSNLEIAPGLNGYYLQMGDTGADFFTLHRVTNGVVTTILTSSTSIYDGASDYGVAIHVSRSESGLWTVRTSTLPANAIATQSTPTPRSCVEDVATVVQGVVVDNNHVPAANGFFGVWARNTSTATQDLEFDNFVFRALAPNTYVNFVNPTQALTEPSVTDLVFTIPVSLSNPSGSVATSVTVSVSSGDTGRLQSYSPQTITWAPGESGTKNATFTVDANAICDDVAVLNFALTGLTGGQSAYLSSPFNHVLTLTDDDMGYVTLVSDNFEDGNANGWTSFGNGTWTANTTAPASGTFSLRHSTTGVVGNSHVVFDTEENTLDGVFTTWQFNVKNYNRLMSTGNNWMVYVAASSTDLFGAGVNGYAVGVDPATTPAADAITLFRVTNGVFTALISAPWEIISTSNEIGVLLTRNESGLWSLSLDQSGDFNDLVAVGTATDVTYDALNYFGARMVYSASNSDKFAIDDLTIVQKGCRSEFYSQAPGGNFSAAIWSPTPVGTPQTIQPSRFTRLVMQTGAPVNVDQAFDAGDIAINTGGSLTGNSNTITVFGNWVTDGTGVFNAGNSHVILKGAVAQSILGSATVTFNNLTIDNDFGTVTSLGQVQTAGLVTLKEGTFQTLGNLRLLSNATKSSSIGRIQAGADIAGDVEIQRFVPAGPATYIYMGAPTVTNPGPHSIENAWDDDITTTGVTGSDFPPPYNFVNIYWYDETVSGSRNNGYTAMTNTANLINPQRGYTIYQSASAQTIDVKGTIQKGNVNVPLSYTVSPTPNSGDGWNLVTNMYPSEIDWVALEANSSDVNSYHYYDANLPGYRVYSANSQVGSGSRYIAHSQAFFVKASAGGQSLNYIETVKSNTNVAFERSEQEASFARIAITRNNEGDEAVLAFHADATHNFESNLDAEKWESPVATSPELALVSSDLYLLTIDVRPQPTESFEIPVYLDLPAAGDYVISFTELQNIPLGSCLSIEDTFTNEITPITEGLTLTVTTGAPYQGNRMIIRVTPVVVVSSQNAICYNASNGVIAVDAPQGNWDWTITDQFGNAVFTGNGSSSFDAVAAGDYTVVLSSTDAGCGSFETPVSITEPSETTFEWTSAIDECNVSSNGEFVLNMTNPGEYTYTLINLMGVEVTSGSGSAGTLILEGLAADDYVLQISNLCVNQEIQFATWDEDAVVANLLVNETAVSFLEGTSSTINLTAEAYNAESVEWTVNGQPIASGHVTSFEITEAGEYVVVLTATRGACVATQTVTITASTFVGVEEQLASKVQVVNTLEGFNVVFGQKAQAAKLVVTSMTGQVIFVQENIGKSGEVVSVNTAAWATGAYNVSVIMENQESIHSTIIK